MRKKQKMELFDIIDENGNPKNVYLKGEFGGFAVHILQEKR